MTMQTKLRSSLPAVVPAVVPADVSAALDDLGIDHVIRGDEATAICPNPRHDDSSPSWSCNQRTGMHHCFSCGWGGSFVYLVAAVRQGSYDAATLWVRTHRVRTNLDGEEVVSKAKERRAREVRESDLWLCGPPPAAELEARSVSEEAAGWSEILWHKDKGCWIFPIRDPRTDRLLGWQEKHGKRHLNRPVDLDRTECVFGWQYLRATGDKGPVVWVESPLDVGRFLTAGWERVVSTYGVEFTDKQIGLMLTQADEVIFAMDNDLAGHRKVSKWLDTHPYLRPYCKVFDYGRTREHRPTRQWVVPPGDGRDPGNLSNEELISGVMDATPAWRTIFEAVQ
jgi:hypothetical protein